MRIVVLGAKGFIGVQVAERFRAEHEVVAVTRENYEACRGTQAEVLINCNGNSRRHWAEQNPVADFEASVTSVEKSLFDFSFQHYCYLSTVDVYADVADRATTREEWSNHHAPSVYGFHKSLAERLVQRFAPKHHILRLGTVVGPGLKKNPVYDLAHGQELFISARSQLNLISGTFIGEVLERCLAGAIPADTYNLAARDAIAIPEIAAYLQVSLKGGGNHLPEYRYDIAVEKLQRWVTLPSSINALEGMFKG